MELMNRLEIASHSVDGAWLLFNLSDAELAELPPEVLEFKALVDQARNLSYDILHEHVCQQHRQHLKIHLVE